LRRREEQGGRRAGRRRRFRCRCWERRLARGARAGAGRSNGWLSGRRAGEILPHGLFVFMNGLQNRLLALRGFDQFRAQQGCVPQRDIRSDTPVGCQAMDRVPKECNLRGRACRNPPLSPQRVCHHFALVKHLRQLSQIPDASSSLLGARSA
jgi:hypothetical protein